MNFDMKKLAEGVIHFLELADVKAEIRNLTDKTAEIMLFDDDGEEDYVGNFADPGFSLEFVGELNGVHIVKANYLHIEALPRHIAGWAVGYGMVT